MMLQLRETTSGGAHECKPTADAIEWRMKYQEMEECFAQLQTQRQGSGIEAGGTEMANSEVESLNRMLLALAKQLAFLFHDKHDLHDSLRENESDKDESMNGPTTQEAVDADFSARLEEALNQQVSEYQAKLDTVTAVNAWKAAELSFELLQIKEREASWSVLQHDIESEAADFKMDLQRLVFRPEKC